MKKFIVTFDVPGREDFVVFCVQAECAAEAIAKAAIKAEDERDQTVWSLVSVEPFCDLLGRALVFSTKKLSREEKAC